MKFVDFTNNSSRLPSDRRKPTVVPAAAPPSRSMTLETDLSKLLGSMKAEPKTLLQSKMLRASRVVSSETIQNETLDILAILRSLKK